MTNADNIDIIGVYKATRKQRKTNMETLLAISMISVIIIMGMWVRSRFQWQGWGKI